MACVIGYDHLHQLGIRYGDMCPALHLYGWVDVDYVLMEDNEPIITET